MTITEMSLRILSLDFLMHNLVSTAGMLFTDLLHVKSRVISNMCYINVFIMVI